MLMSAFNFYVTYGVLQSFWLCGAIAAWWTNMLTVSQMQRYGVQKGMPYLWHLGMWNDLVTIHPFLACMFSLFWAQSSRSWWLLPAAFVGIAISSYANWAWTRGSEVIQSHAGVANDKVHADGHMSLVGMIHIPHMALVIAIIFLTVVGTARGEVPWKLSVVGAFILLAHICVGQHWTLRLLDPPWNPWPAQPLDGALAIVNVLSIAAAFCLLFDYTIKSG
jgi:hypothetical protein